MRRILPVGVIALLFMLPLPAAAQVRAPPSNDNLTNMRQLAQNEDGNISDIEEASLQANEATASCATDGADSKSVWFRVDVPAGKLIFTAESAQYAPVITLYTHDSDVADIVEIACVTAPTGTTTLNIKVSAGAYVIRVAQDDLLLPAASFLHYDFELKPPSGKTRPVNDDPDDATPLLFNKVYKASNLEYATYDRFVNNTCNSEPLYHAVWYRFYVSEPMYINISAEGSVHSTDTGFLPPSVQVVRDAGANAYLATDCLYTGGIGGSAKGRVQLTQAGYYLIGVFNMNARGLTGPSTSQLVISPENYDLLENADFEDGLDEWTVKKSTGDGLVTGADAISGQSFRFVGNAGEKSQLKQSFATADGALIPANTVVGFKYSVKTLVPTNKPLTYSITVTFNDGTTQVFAGVVEAPLTAGSTYTETIDYLITRKGAVSVGLKFKNKATSGSVVLDNLIMLMNSFSYTRGDVLPMPLPPTN